MNLLRYDEEVLVQQLNALPLWGKVAFAVACAYRLMPSYARFFSETGWGNPRLLNDALEYSLRHAWDCPIDEGTIADMIDAVMVVIPDENDVQSQYQPFGEDAGAAVAYVLRTMRTGDSNEAAWAARRAYEAVELLATRIHALNDSSPIDEDAILTSRLVQCELSRQQRDISDIAAGCNDPTHTVERLALRARKENAIQLNGK